jgi:hypothetical protein
MRVARLVLSFSLSLSLSISLAAQQTAASNPQALQFLQRSLAALGGTQTVTDVSLTGTARRIAGSDDETGTVTLKASAAGASLVDLTLPSGQHSEIHNLSAVEPTGAWLGPDRVSHPIAHHNLLTEPAWFLPTFAIARRLSTPGYTATYIGRETRNGLPLEHIAVSQTASSPDSSGGISFEHLTQVDFFLDATTLLPAAISFNIHPDNNALLDVPIEIHFSDYRQVNGSQIPYRIQKYLNNGLVLDLQVESASLNAGPIPRTFSAE